MQFIGVFLSFLLAVLGYIKEKNVYNPLTVFMSFFGIILLLSSLKLYDLYEVKQFTYFIVVLGLFSFFIGYLFIDLLKSKGKQIKKERDSQPSKSLEFNPNYKILFFIYIIVIVFLSYRTFQVLIEVSQGTTLTEIRNHSQNILELSGLYNLTNNYVIKPIVFALIPLAVIDLFIGKRKILLPSFIVALLYAFSEGGRFIFLYYIIQFFAGAIIFKKKIIVTKKTKRRIFLLLTTSIIFILFITNIRSSDTSILKSAYMYLSGAIPHLDYRLGIIADSDRTLGLSFVMGYLTTFFVILNGFGILPYPEFYNKAIELGYVEDFVRIGEDSLFNAFVTPFYYFYLDGGILGILIFSFIYGLTFTLVYYFLQQRPTIMLLSVYLLLLQGALTSMVRWQFYNPTYSLSFVFLFFIVKLAVKKSIVKHK